LPEEKERRGEHHSRVSRFPPHLHPHEDGKGWGLGLGGLIKKAAWAAGVLRRIKCL